MNDLFGADDASTPLTPEEQRDLLPSYIATRAELNEAEQQNILAAQSWAYGLRRPDPFDEKWLKRLHRRMFEQVWSWAGRYRTTPRNIGVDPWQIAPQMRIFLDDARFWVKHATYSPDELAIRFHHRLVYIHPFANGNGRHARLAADVLIVQLGGERFDWGQATLVDAGEARSRYIQALQEADRGRIEALVRFARSGAGET
ncbi:mobile mystery protein B [Gloeobacter kilaueensis]|uniref:Filamentation induced by cAMP protein Fic n=1 Tax=Gloeobacter kilaueensis (strain ATCC BAA-2537 / CCAP 1431/1 / ULC 316 / JS1) TaxID=1183438 RepID=U5QQM0_GLOK1|nr:mobile mystery protein B [Gloeobacter kilaueensis]AGY59914.1 filamentation induced by cAMP protein Fic [Gloeobacter kilaueensis JS1]